MFSTKMPRLVPLVGVPMIVAGALAPGTVVAQTVSGTLLDGGSAERLLSGSVSLVATDGSVVDHAEVDDTGRFELTAPGPGAYFIRGACMGYRTRTDGVLELGADAQVQVEFRLRSAATQIGGMAAADTLGEALGVRRLENEGFYERERMGAGQYLGPRRMQTRVGMSLPVVFRGISGASVVEREEFDRPVLRLRCAVAPVAAGAVQPAFGGFVNGVQVFKGEFWDVEADVRISDILAIEAYTDRGELPIEYNEVGLCGGVLIWTR